MVLVVGPAVVVVAAVVAVVVEGDLECVGGGTFVEKGGKANSDPNKSGTTSSDLVIHLGLMPNDQHHRAAAGGKVGRKRVAAAPVHAS